MDYFFSLIFNNDFKYCFGMGWNTDTISIAWTLSYIFINCAKKMFEKLCDLSENWRGAEAKWFDDCDTSDTAELDIWDYDIFEAESNQI